MACDLPEPLLRRTRNGYFPGRSGDIQIIPREPATFGVSHSGPWDYLQGVPMFLYGPGHVAALGRVSSRVTMADLAPTLAAHLNFTFQAQDGVPMEEALPNEGAHPPPLIVIVVWDGGGRNLLARYPRAWPNLRRLIPKGVWFDRATLGSSPSVTPPVHTTLGTGAFPRHHGLVDFVYRQGGQIVDAYETGPQDLETPSLADEWDAANGNAPVVGMLAYKNWHLGMLGYGAAFEGGDHDLAIVVNEERSRWGLNQANRGFFRFPDYVNGVAGLREGIRIADAMDGRREGRYFGEGNLSDPTFIWRTPAFTFWQTKVFKELIRREGFGADDTPDLLFTNYKQIDQAGHLWTMNSRQMVAAVKASDQALDELIRTLNAQVGRGRWIMALTADHGTTPNPAVSGAFAISKERLVEDIENVFAAGRPGAVIQRFGRTHLWINTAKLESRGFTLRQVATYVSRYTRGQNVLNRASLPRNQWDKKVFSAAFPSDVLDDLPCLPAGTGR